MILFWSTAGPDRVLVCVVMINFVQLAYFAHALLADQLNMKGIAPANLQLYNSDDLYCPGNPGKKLTISMINDDFCDCPEDGFDEPGTSACNKGNFHCKNEGFFPKTIESIFVNDGVCDCCDGSDEKPGFCLNVCNNLKEEHDRLEKERAKLIEQGLNAKNEMIKNAAAQRKMVAKQLEMGKLEVQAGETQLSVLKNLPNLSAQIQSASTPQNYEDFCQELQSKFHKIHDLFENLKAAPQTCSACDEAIKEFEAIQKDKSNKSRGEMIFDAILDEDSSTELEKKTFWESLKNLDFGELKEMIMKYRVTKTVTVVVPAAATSVPPKSDPVKDLESKIIESRIKIEQLEKKYDLDFGENDVFLPLHGQCIQSTHGKYQYKICFFDKVTQSESTKSAFNHETTLGNWKGWGVNSDGTLDHTEMIYDGGQQCWQGPQRSATIKLECGTENTIVEVAEPSICTYIIKKKNFNPGIENLEMGKKRSHQVTRSILKSFPTEANKVLKEEIINSEDEKRMEEVSGSEKEYASEAGSDEEDQDAENSFDEEDGDMDGFDSEADDGFSEEELENVSADEMSEAEQEIDEDSIEDLKRKKKAKKTFEEPDLGSAISQILGEKTKNEQPILARRKGIERKIEDEKLEARARALMKRQRMAAKDSARVMIPDMSRANYEKQLKKAATKGVVQLFNAIHQHQVTKEKLEKEKAAAGTAKKAEIAAQIKQISKTSFLDMLKGGASAQIKKQS